MTQPIHESLAESSSPHEYVRLLQAAERLGISDDTLWRIIKPGLISGEIVSYKLGRIRPILWPSLLAYLGRYFNGAIQPKRGKQ